MSTKCPTSVHFQMIDADALENALELRAVVNKSRDVDKVKQEAAHKEAPKVRDDKAR